MGCQCKTRADTAIEDNMQRVPEPKLVFQTKVFKFIQKFPCCKLHSGGKTESGKVRCMLYVRGRLCMYLYHQKITTNTKSSKCEVFYFIRNIPCCYCYVLEVKLCQARYILHVSRRLYCATCTSMQQFPAKYEVSTSSVRLDIFYMSI